MGCSSQHSRQHPVLGCAHCGRGQLDSGYRQKLGVEGHKLGVCLVELVQLWRCCFQGHSLLVAGKLVAWQLTCAAARYWLLAAPSHFEIRKGVGCRCLQAIAFLLCCCSCCVVVWGEAVDAFGAALRGALAALAPTCREV